jgi:hypothetical protein
MGVSEENEVPFSKESTHSNSVDVGGSDECLGHGDDLVLNSRMSGSEIIHETIDFS